MLHVTPLPTLNMDLRMAKLSGSSSRILYDIPCRVCQDHSSGKHYGIFACDGCAGFFKRSIRRSRQYVCKAKSEGNCLVDKTHRNQCRACRLTKCIRAGMNKEAVQHERGPRNSTIRRQMSMYFKDALSTEPSTEYEYSQPTQPNALDLAVSRGSSPSEGFEAPRNTLNHEAAVFLAAQAQLQAQTAFFPRHFPLSSAESVCETAARLLFMNVQWAKNIPTFTSLHYKDQLLLLEETWREMFVLGAVQFLLPIELSHLLAAHVAVDADQTAGLIQDVHSFQETLYKFNQLNVDMHEYACLRAIVLFKTCFDGSCVPSSSSSTSSSELRSLINPNEVARLQDAAQVTLSQFIASAYPTQPFRFGKLLLLLPALRAVSASTIEELFFRQTIGHIPIERIICDMYKKSNDS